MKAIKIIKNIILDIIIIFLIILIAFEIMSKNEPLNIFNYYLFMVKSGSMQNELLIGDYIIVKKSKDYKVGDIVTYKKDEMYVTHRIVKIDNDMVTTKGDANASEDPTFNKEDIIGKVIFKSKILNFIIDRKIFVISLIVIIMIVDTIIKEKTK